MENSLSLRLSLGFVQLVRSPRPVTASRSTRGGGVGSQTGWNRPIAGEEIVATPANERSAAGRSEIACNPILVCPVLQPPYWQLEQNPVPCQRAYHVLQLTDFNLPSSVRGVWFPDRADVHTASRNRNLSGWFVFSFRQVHPGVNSKLSAISNMLKCALPSTVSGATRGNDAISESQLPVKRPGRVFRRLPSTLIATPWSRRPCVSPQ
jgi:hypothetical protein